MSEFAFEKSSKLKSITFETNSSLEALNNFAFSEIFGPEKIVFPPSLKQVGFHSLSHVSNLKTIEFLGRSIKIDNQCCSNSSNLVSIYFTNADQIEIKGGSFFGIPKKTKIYMRIDVKLSGNNLNEYQDQVFYIDKEEKLMNKEVQKKIDDQKIEFNEKIPKSAIKNESEEHIQKDEKENSDLREYVSYLQSRLQKYEEFVSFEEFSQGKRKRDDKDEFMNVKTTNNLNNHQSRTIIGEEDEKFHKVVSKIGEGSTCEVYKVIDERSGEVFCKKVIKEINDEGKLKLLKNTLKEIDVVQGIKHPCICESLGYNLQEELPKSLELKQPKDDDNDDDDDDEEEEEHSKNEEKKTTIALFFEFLPYSIKSLIDKEMMNNTLKVRIALEVAFAMSHIHHLGMIHRDLKIENIMLNNVLESKVIDFGLVHVSSLSESGSSLTKGIGTFCYMSPEMINEEDYTNKTDVYSYGIVLFVLFTGRLPKQTMRERLDNVPIKFPKTSSKISKYCVQLIKQCTVFDSNRRPTFDEIISDMFNNSFNLASEIDHKIIIRRFHELNRFKLQYDQEYKTTKAQNIEENHKKKTLS